jgi:hypothetical protein
LHVTDSEGNIVKFKSVIGLKIRTTITLVLLFYSVGSQVWAADVNLTTAPGRHLVRGGGAMAKLGQDLADLFREYEQYLSIADLLTDLQFRSSNPALNVVQGYVAIEAVAANDTEALRLNLLELNMQNVAAFGGIVSGRLPVAALARLDRLATLKFARPSYFVTNAGLVTSQGDTAMRSDIVREKLGIDGQGITVGTLSDSFNCFGGAAGDVASGDLPQDIDVLDDSFCQSATDEGRALMQLITDIAPGADQAFHSASGGQPAFVQGIFDLADAGCDVIVDDIIYLAEPMFQDGIVAQAVNSVVNAGIAYFSSAGNLGRNTYESAFVSSGTQISIDNTSTGIAHDFNPGPDIDIFQSISIPALTTIQLSLQWDSPYFSVSGSPGSPNDLNLFLIDNTATTVLAGSAISNIGGDPLEVLVYTNNSDVPMDANLLIVKTGGPDPDLMKYVIFNPSISINEFGTPGSTSFGHSNATGAASVAAAFYNQTPQFGSDPAVVEPFSSLGGISILFDSNGNQLPEPEVRDKPNFTAPDGTNTTFFGAPDSESDGFPNFFGTSASVAHAGAVAALLLAANPSLLPDEIYAALETTALDMDNPYTSGFDAGFDFATGWGLIQAERAINEVLVQLPFKPVTSIPASGSSNIPIDVSLGWIDGGGAIIFDVYFGTDPTPDGSEFKGNQTAVAYNPGPLQYNTTYFWRIDARNKWGTSTGDVWSFKTVETPPLPPPQLPGKPIFLNPGIGSVGVSIDTDLSWTDGGNAESYDIYFGTNPVPDSSEFLGNQNSTLFDPGVLSYETTYYWRIDSKNSNGTTTGDIWSFTTDAPPPVLTVVAEDAQASEKGSNPGLFRIQRSGTASVSLMVYFRMTGSAENGTDYTLIESPKILAAGASYLDVKLTPTDDALIEAGETATLTLSTSDKYTLGSPDQASITITDYRQDSALIVEFVTRFYLFGLERSPDPLGLDFWVLGLESGTLTGRDIADGFLLSPEFANKNTTNQEYLAILYKVLFGREPDPPGLRFWLDALNSGAGRGEVLSSFILSEEFEKLSNEFGIKAYKGDNSKFQQEAVEAFVTRFYQEALDRDPDPEGLLGWVDNLLNQIQSGADVAYGFIFSPEFIARDTTDAQYLTILYNAFFDRQPDRNGFDFWLTELNTGRDRGYVLDGFLYSTEFAALSRSYGIIPY